MSSHVTVLRGILSEGTVSFHAVFAKAFKSIPVGVFLSQSYFWQENRKYKSEKIHLEIDGKQFFTKTAKDWFDETGLTTDQQQKVRSILCTASVLEERLVGNPAKMYYHIDFEALVSAINNYLISGVSSSTDRRGWNVFKEQTKRGKAKKRVGNKPILSLGLNPKLESDLNPSLESDKIPSSPILESLDSFESEGERTPTPAPSNQNLQSQKNESGLVAPGRDDFDERYYAEKSRRTKAKFWFNPETVEAQKPPSPNSAPPPSPHNLGFCGTCAGAGKRNGICCADCEGSGNQKFEVTAIASPTDLPGVTLVEASDFSEFKSDAMNEEKNGVWKFPPAPTQTNNPLRYDQCPLPKNANELKWRMEEYFKQHSEDWRLLLDNARVNWSEEKIAQTTLEYCLY